jgi:hypothetical protein
VDDTTLNGVEYHYRATASNFVGESGPSLEVHAMPAGLPDPPGGVVAEGLNGSVRVSWEPPEETGGLVVSGYKVYGITGDLQINLIAELGPDTREFDHPDLQNGEVYLYAVRAFTGVGESDLSEIVEARPMGAPSQPSDLEALWMVGAVYLTWSVPVPDGGSPITGYSIRRNDWEPGVWLSLSAFNTTFLDTDVEHELTYNYTVRAQNVVDHGPGITISFTVPEEELPPPETINVNAWPLLAVVITLAVIAAVLVAMMRRTSETDRDSE